VKVLIGSKAASVVVVEFDVVVEDAPTVSVGPVVEVTASGGEVVVESAAAEVESAGVVGVTTAAVVGVTTAVVAVDRPAQPARASDMVRRRIRRRTFFTA